MNSTTIEGDAGALVVHDLGGRGKATIVIGHATGFHGRCYRALANELHEAASLFALDFRGHGDSDAPTNPDGWGWSQIAEDLLAAIDFIVAQRPSSKLHGFGHSMGGAAMLEAHRTRPDLFESIFVFEPIVPPQPVNAEESPIVRGALGRSPRFDSFDAAIARYSARPPLGLLRPDVLEDYVRHGFAPSVNEDGHESVVLKCLPENEAETYRHAGRDIRLDQMAALSGPITVACSGDGQLPAQLAAAVAATIPNASLATFPDLTHFGPLQDPVVVADALRPIIAG